MWIAALADDKRERRVAQVVPQNMRDGRPLAVRAMRWESEIVCHICNQAFIFRISDAATPAMPIAFCPARAWLLAMMSVYGMLNVIAHHVACSGCEAGATSARIKSEKVSEWGASLTNRICQRVGTPRVRHLRRASLETPCFSARASTMCILFGSVSMDALYGRFVPKSSLILSRDSFFHRG
jgi:hypothetical protein